MSLTTQLDFFRNSGLNLGIKDIIITVIGFLLLSFAVLYVIVAEQSIPTWFRIVFFIWICYSIVDREYFLPIIVPILLLDYFSIIPLQILPAKTFYTFIIVLLSALYNFRFIYSNLVLMKMLFIIPVYFLVYVFITTRLHGIEESDFINIVAIFTLLLGYISEDNKTFNLLYISVIVVSILLTFQGVFLQERLELTLDDGQIDEANRLSWIDPNYLSLLIDMGILLSIHSISNVNQFFLRLLLITFLLFQLYVLFLFASRGGILACILSLSYLKKSELSVKKVVYYLGAFIFIILSFYYLGFLEVFLQRFQEDNLSTAGSRTMIWMDLINNFTQRDIFSFLFGTGATSSWYISNLISHITSPHNNYLEILLDFGIIGFLMFFGFITLIFYKYKNCFSRAIIVLICVGCLTISPFNYTMPWIFILVSIYYGELKLRDQLILSQV